MLADKGAGNVGVQIRASSQPDIQEMFVEYTNRLGCLVPSGHDLHLQLVCYVGILHMPLQVSYQSNYLFK